MRWLPVLLVVLGCDCSFNADASSLSDSGSDSGLRDPGYDIPPELWIDGGDAQTGGCYGRRLDHFVVEMATTRTDNLWCAGIYFESGDGGFTPLFPEFESPEGFAVSEARWAPTCAELYLDNGRLDERYPPVHAFVGSLVFDGYYMGKPYVGHFDATIRLGYYVYSASDALVGFSSNCPGP